MSKRYIFPQEYGDRKRAKLDVTVSDHNFPVSQAGPTSDTWGDDNDDEILLLASQVCEQAYNDKNTSFLPDYSLCMNPVTTSTQYEPVPSTSKAPGVFKRPNKTPLSMVSTKLRDRCEKMSLPLSGITSKINSMENVHLSDDLIVNDKIFKGQDGDNMYKQYLKLQEENTKLKSENGKLLEKCVTKEGEASILRTQLKSCQTAVDNVRLEKIKAQENAKAEWMDKIKAASNEINNLKSQLDFKNIEIISIKEKCKMLESPKIKLNQVTVGPNDISTSHRQNYSVRDKDGSMTQLKRVKTASSGVQTENKAYFVNYNIPYREVTSNLKKILPLILEATAHEHSVLEYNKKLQTLGASLNKFRIFSTFHRLPSTPSPSRSKSGVKMSSVYEEISCIVAGDNCDARYLNMLNIVESVLNEVHGELSTISHRLTTSFLKEMDERSLYKDEQAILARRTVAVLSVLLDNCESKCSAESYEKRFNELIGNIRRICTALETTNCSVLYSGFLLSITRLLTSIHRHTEIAAHIIDIAKVMISSRPMPVVADATLQLLSVVDECALCTGTVGNLRVDYDQGVLLYKKDSCHLQVLLKQVEVYIKCVESAYLYSETIHTSKCLLLLYNSCGGDSSGSEVRCECRCVLMQVIVYALLVCARFLDTISGDKDELISVCRSGVRILYESVLRDVEFGSQLGFNEGHLIELCEIIKRYEHQEIYLLMLSEISSIFQLCAEETSASYSQKTFVESFNTFSITD
ncbi:uncharacterized protein LOC126970801 isoform X2 [Leptidea sinapis]|uniref:uncharacterized protein LOC126970801 isoform X2 n=1 Tax=Leptidea sinapis TaxID=189913 RepID=UPI0021291C4B|nr:uncharacterized protein LOC126970801 isoform X2 [Leptidea sinapis]